MNKIKYFIIFYALLYIKGQVDRNCEIPNACTIGATVKLPTSKQKTN